MNRLDDSVLEQKLGYVFREKALLVKALTHTTYVNENPDYDSDYERLEFLGDAVLDLLVAHLLYDRFPHANEGDLSQRRSHVVRRDTLSVLAQRFDLANFVRLSEGQRKNGMGISPRILADTFESIVGAMYLDGGYEAVAQCFTRILQDAITKTEKHSDHKTELQELCHKLGLAQPVYTVLSITGPDHDRRYSCDVRMHDKVWGQGSGRSKKAAEQACAHQAIEVLSREKESVHEERK